MSIVDLLKKFSPLDDEEQAPEANMSVETAPLVKAAVPAQIAKQAPSPVPPMDEGYDVATEIAPLLEQREANYKAPRIEIPEVDGTGDREKHVEFKNSLEDLKNHYNAAKEDARSRQMKAEMLAAFGDNIGGIVAGAQAMNAKTAVAPIQHHKMEVKDLVGKVDKTYQNDYGNLLKQYKDLKDGGLTAKDRLYANIAQAQLDSGAARLNNNIVNANKSNIGRAVTLKNKAAEQDELTPKDRAELTNINKTLDRVDKLEVMSKDFHTGPVAGRVEKIKAYIGANKGARAAMTAQLQGIVSSYGSSISGSTIGEGEFSRLQKQVPDENDTPEVYAAKLARFKDELESSRHRVLDDLARSGRNVKNFRHRVPIEDIAAEEKAANPASAKVASAPYGEVVEKGGKTYKWNPTAGKYQLAN